MPDAPEPQDLDDEAPDDFVTDQAIVFDARTERLKVYASLIRATLPRIGTSSGFEGREPEIDGDVTTARNLAIEAIFADIRRIAGAGLHVNGEGE